MTREWWGLIDHIESVADQFAASGFVTLAPDFYESDPAFFNETRPQVYQPEPARLAWDLSFGLPAPEIELKRN